jgi:hypothetical protein
MLNTPLADGDLKGFLDSLLPTPEPIVRDNRIANQRGITLATNTKNLITGIYHHNTSQSHIKGTLWGAVQAAQYYSDHLSINRGTDDANPAENRFKRLTSGNNLGSRAFSMCLEIVKVSHRGTHPTSRPYHRHPQRFHESDSRLV